MTAELYAGSFIKTLPTVADISQEPQSVHNGGVLADRGDYISATVPGFCELTTGRINDILKSDYCICPFTGARTKGMILQNGRN